MSVIKRCKKSKQRKNKKAKPLAARYLGTSILSYGAAGEMEIVADFCECDLEIIYLEQKPHNPLDLENPRLGIFPITIKYFILKNTLKIYFKRFLVVEV